jgi:formate dehydrogenase subunit gamma
MAVPFDATTTSIATVVRSALEKHQLELGPLLPVLHDVQNALGFIPSEAVALIANGLNLSRAEVHGVVTYYSHFNDHEPAQCVVKVCRAEACKSMGADALFDLAKAHLSCQSHAKSKDGYFSLEPVFCLGLCANSPAIMINEEPYARVTNDLFKELIAEVRKHAVESNPKRVEVRE